MAAPRLRRVLTLTDVVLLNVLLVFGLRGIGTAAKLGAASLLLWTLAVAAFFVPLGFAVAELATRDPGEGGFYRWTRRAFGDAHGFFCGWFYWVTNLGYLPFLLFFLAANVVFVANRPELGADPWFVVPLSLGVLWFATLVSIRGLSLGRWITNAGGAATCLAALLLIAAGAAALLKFGSATSWTWGAIDASLREPRTVAFFGTLSFALVGIELAPVMGDEIREPRRVLPRAILLSGIVIAALYIVGTAAVLVAVPRADVNPLSGALDAVRVVGQRVGWPVLPAVVAVLVSLATASAVSAWLGGTARLPFAAGLDRFLPDAVARLHPSYGTPHVSILIQALIASMLIIASQVGATVREAYLILLDMTIVLQFVPFLYIFAALPRLRRGDDPVHVVRVPGGRAGLWLVVALGLMGTALTLGTAVIPPDEVRNPWLFELKLWGGVALFSVVGLLLFRRYAARGARSPGNSTSIATS